MNFGQTQDLSNANIYSTEPSLIKRKDPKKMTLSELDEYINKNKSRLKTESESPKKEENFPPPNRENIPSQREDDSNTIYIQELESKINYLENENEELKRNFAQLSELLEKERNEQQNKIQEILYRNEQKFLADNKNLLNIYKINLIVNLLWPIIFFLFKLKVLAFFWILILILIVGYMIYKFYQENKLSSYLLTPYILWLVFASVLNLLEL